ncbi:NAD binding domain of 6-phosphogluconate dehydrogenase-domain-containing protein [Ilyonectria robusta]|uniref:NAD binding domain of 6-phosphogluconate dehydrogenase-domain-containing protein n=1 Tax=Ilyonectria robusta TaxID=1079257 RepID=UPI001E8DEFB1|nr:NAD binding domain of 6-phosphogluconate dehydrogenase-domain-containing protein [Ilyonectria robusta]KAH8663273.1 NAD binding domain of 6-phosphogluconate dehydrogenase-domain-containing protein [Ilyonectria robusta]
MALNLHNKLKSQGTSLTYSNRTLSKGEVLSQEGAQAKNGITELVRECDDNFLMVSTDAVLKGLINEMLRSDIDLKGKTIIDCSTTHPDTATEVASLLQAAGAEFVASPVFGANTVAQAGRLLFAMAGSQAAIQRLEPLIVGVMGRKIVNMGENARDSVLLKVTGNVLLVVFLEAIAETQVLAEKNGLGTQVMEEVIFENFGPVLGGYSRRMTSGSYAPKEGMAGFSVANTIKDAKHALRIAQDLDVRMPALDLATNNMLSAKAYGGENLDGAALYGVLRSQSGLPFWSNESRQQ